MKEQIIFLRYLGALPRGNSFPLCSNLQINYVFASEEYPDYVCSPYNDAFGFFISGPGITGVKNIAVIPTTTIGVAINSVNNGVVGAAGIDGGCTSLAYSSLFVDNATGPQIAYNGFTTPLTASASITPCQTYHLKLVIADAADAVYDSGVFLLQNDLTCIIPVLTVTASPSSICAGQSSTLTASSSGSVSGTYTWTPNTNLSTNSGSIVVASPLTSTIYTVSSSNICGQIITQTVSVTVGNPSINAAGSFCISSPDVNLIGTPSGGIWSGTGITNTLSGIFSPAVAGVGSHIISYQNAGGCGGITTTTIVVNNTPTITVNSATICSGSTTTLIANGANNYTWSPGTALSSTTGSMVTANPSVTTNYTILGAIGTCAGTTTVDIIVNSNPTITVNSASICSGSTATLTATGADSYSWSPSNTLSSSTGSFVIANPIVTTSYTLTGFSLNGCSSNKITTINVNALPSLTVIPVTICPLETATLTAYPTTLVSYTWSPGLISTNGVSVTGSPSVTTNYTVSATDNNGCIGNTLATINAVTNLSVTASSSSSVVCTGSSVNLIGLGASSYTWASSGGGMSSTNGAVITVTPIGASTTYTVNGSSGACSAAPYTLTVNVNLLPTITTSVSPGATVCLGTPITLNAGGAITYTWSNGVIDGIALTPTVAGAMNYSVTGTDLNGCINYATQNVTINSLPNIMISTSNTLLCVGQTASLTASGASSYTWNTTGTTSVIAVSPITTTNYTVTGVDGNGCLNTATITQSVSVCNDIQTIISNETISTYPNPTNGIATIEINATFNLIIMDVLGKVVYNQTLNKGKHIINLSNYANGLYFVRATSNGKVNTTRLIKE